MWPNRIPGWTRFDPARSAAATSRARSSFDRAVRRRVIIGLGVLAFLAVCLELARFTSAENTERSAIFALLQEQARGDARPVVARLSGCEAGCAAGVTRTVARVRRPGAIKILRLDTAGGSSLRSTTGRARVAWAADVTAGGLAVVQCITVRRNWSFLSGASVTLLRLSAPLPPEQGC
jgi:hypothetical protein